jgi:hypothetical protein
MLHCTVGYVTLQNSLTGTNEMCRFVWTPASSGVVLLLENDWINHHHRHLSYLHRESIRSMNLRHRLAGLCALAFILICYCRAEGRLQNYLLNVSPCWFISCVAS